MAATSSSKTLKTVLLIAVAQIVILASFGQAQLIPGVPTGPFAQCWTAFQGIPGCVAEIFGAFAGGRTGGFQISPACCKVIADISDNCWRGMFPGSPFASPIKSFCSGGTSPPSR